MSDTVLLRIGIAIALSLLFGAIIYFGRVQASAVGGLLDELLAADDADPGEPEPLR